MNDQQFSEIILALWFIAMILTDQRRISNPSIGTYLASGGMVVCVAVSFVRFIISIP